LLSFELQIVFGSEGLYFIGEIVALFLFGSFFRLGRTGGGGFHKIDLAIKSQQDLCDRCLPGLPS
jgi:hypothetical protein